MRNNLTLQVDWVSEGILHDAGDSANLKKLLPCLCCLSTLQHQLYTEVPNCLLISTALSKPARVNKTATPHSARDTCLTVYVSSPGLASEMTNVHEEAD